jgi:hypothetical protein
MVNQIFFWLIFYLVYSFNLTVLVAMIKDGYFNHRFWTRSMRGVFMVPPFAIFVACLIFLKHSLVENFKNWLFVMEKRKDSEI